MDEKKKKQKTIIIVAVAVVLALVIILSVALPLTVGKNKAAYTITYNNLDGIANENPSEYKVDTPTIVLKGLTHTDVDKKFLGWYDQMTGGNKITEIAVGSKGNIILYARWQIPTVGLKYMLINGDKEYSVSNGDVKDVNVVIPSRYEGKPVTAIEPQAFAYLSNITSVIIPDSVTTIGNMAFGFCPAMTSVIIPDSVTTLGFALFAFDKSLTSVTLSKNITAISDKFFYSCEALKEIVIPEGVTTIGDESFLDCRALASINIPKSVTKIDENSFSFCSGLTSITVDSANANYKSVNNCLLQKDSNTNLYSTMLRGCPDSVIPDTVTEILGAFSGCDNVKTINISSNVIKISIDALAECSNVTSLTVASDNQNYKSEGNCLLSKDGKILYKGFNTSTIPNNVTVIDQEAFSGCTELKSVTIPESVLRIEHQAFDGCEGLTSIDIPKNVEYLDFYFIEDCTGLEKITVASDNKLFKSEGNCLLSKDGKKLIRGCKASVIPSSVTSIEHSAFSNCEGLKTINLPSGVIKVDCMAFTECRNIEKITVDSANAIYKSEGNCLLSKDGTELFIGCKTSVIPSSVKTIKFLSFASCEGLTSITLPSSVTTIEESAFSDCVNLTSIFIPSTVEIIEADVFSESNKLTIKCQVAQKPIGWNEFWNFGVKETLWGQAK